jgi:tricorn protease
MLRFMAGLLALILANGCLADDHPPLLLRHPTVSARQIVFVYGGDLWSVPKEGGVAQRLTAANGAASLPVFSPDGTEIAFTGTYDGNADVYVIPASGGSPRRLTYHPSPDLVVGWTRDGKQVLFASRRNSAFRYSRLFTVSRDGGFPSEVPLTMAAEGSYSPTERILRMFPSITRSKFGSAIVAAKHRPSGSQDFPIRASLRFHVIIRTISIPCGWAIACFFSLTAMARSPDSMTRKRRPSESR